MSHRTNHHHTWLTARTSGGSRGTPREFDDDNLIQTIKKCDVFHSETPSDFERFQLCGMTAFPLKQEEDEQQQQSQGGGQQGGAEDGFNQNQPSGPSAECMMNYMNGSRSHPVAGLCDDRRVRPYGMSEGEGAFYAPDGSEQMLYFKENGTYLVSLDNKSVKDKKDKKTRQLLVGHVEKEMQTHKIEQQQQSGQTGAQGGQQQKKEKYKHEGKKVNTGIRFTKDKIEFVVADQVVGYYNTSGKKWYFEGDTVEHNAKTISQVGSERVELVGKSYVGIDSKGANAPRGNAGDPLYKKTFIPIG